MLILQNISYIHPNKNLLFEQLHLTINDGEKIALIGNNGAGKSTLLKIITQELHPLDGRITTSSTPYYVPQILRQYDYFTVAQVLNIEKKLNALQEILNGHLTEENYTSLEDDWTIEERCNDALNYWQLTDLELTQKMETLSGGQKTKVFLAGISIHQPALVLLDEPSNHLDLTSRQLLYDFIRATKSTILVVSHDRKLLNCLERVCELGKQGIHVYGGNYDFYINQKRIEHEALQQDLHNKEKALRKAKEKEREIAERQRKLDSRGKSKQEKAGVARIMMNTLRNKAENSSSKITAVHTEKLSGISKELHELRTALPNLETMKMGFDNSGLHRGKILVKADEINFSYGNHTLWNEQLSFQITSGERIALKGPNGSGKTSLINIILGTLSPHIGTIYRAENNIIYIDQDYSMINSTLNLYEQAQQFNTSALQEHEIKTRLNRFLFTKDDWDKTCKALSGGEKMRLMLCCMTMSRQSPNMIILDEPTNNLDLQNLEILTAAINEYQGTLLIVSHDETFLKQANINKILTL